MTPYALIESTLFGVVRDMFPSAPISYPSAELAPRERGTDSPWFALHNLRATSFPATLGDGGEDNHPGVLQVDVNVPIGKGSGEALALCDTIASAFPAGRSLPYTGGQVRVSSVSVGQGAKVSGYYTVPVSVTYYARSVRRP